MNGTDPLFDALARTAPPAAVDALAALVRDGADDALARVNPLRFAAERGLDEDDAIAALLQGSRLGLFEMTWNVLCPSCGGVLDANATLRNIQADAYHCAFCQVSCEPVLDDTVEVSFAVSPRVRWIAAHDPASLGFWDYHRQVFFGSGVAFPDAAAFADLAGRAMIESAEIGPGERLILSVSLPTQPVVLFEPVTHVAHVLAVEGEPAEGRQEVSVVLTGVRGSVGRSVVRPGPARLTLENRTDRRLLPGLFVEGAALGSLIGGRQPFLTAKRLLSNQVFRDIYRTDTLDIDQRLKILNLTFLFTDLKGSTELYERVGDLVAYDLVRAHFRVLTEIVAGSGGAVVKTIGDAVMATFPTADRAVVAALAMRDSMRRLNAERGADDLVLKIGLHTGPCLAVNLNDRQDYFGQTVNVASRVQDLAAPDAIVASDAALADPLSRAALDARGVRAEPETRRLRGIEDKVTVFALV